MNRYGVWLVLAQALWLAPLWAQTAPSLTEVADESLVPEESQQNSGPYPRFGSLKKPEVNVRSGPGNQYPIIWIYQRAWYPIQILTRYDNYYKVRDAEAEEGWVHVNMISKRQTALVASREPALLLKKPNPQARRVARLAAGVIVAIKDCEDKPYCAVEVVPSGEEGFVLKSTLEMIE
jgi:SH3-like domain-containing protein